MNTSIKTTCPYCGVGCGIEATVDQQRHQLTIRGDLAHPANFGRLCSKGSALADTVDLTGRLMQPQVQGRVVAWQEALDRVADTFRAIIAKHGADSVAIYGSGQLLTEDYYVANKLMKGFIGSANIDTNSRLCMSSSVAGHKRAFGSDSVPGCYEDFEQAELIILIGSNAAWCHPVSFQRIRAAKTANPGLKVVVIDPRKTSSCDIADLHLALSSGSDAVLFNGLLRELQRQHCLDTDYIERCTEGFEAALANVIATDVELVSRQCGLSVDDVQVFYDWFCKHEKVLSLYSQGINQSSSGTDKVNSIINCHLATGRIGRAGAGPFSLTGQPNAMGGREVGGLAHQLAAHMDFSNPRDIERVARFWQSPNIAQKPGYPAVELFDAIYEGKVQAVWIMGTNPVVSLPNADKVKQALERCPFVVVSDCMERTDTTALAHVLLPAQGWSEKDGTVTNSERRISRQRALFQPAGHAKPDWWIISQVAQRLGFTQAFAYRSVVEIFREHAALSGFENDSQHGLRDFDISAFSDISQSEYDQLRPLQWPVNQAYPDGRARLFEDGHFFSASGKAQFIAVFPKAPQHSVDASHPLILNTGRLRDQWHTMTRTALSAKLNQHRPEPWVEINPVDASGLSLADQDLATIESVWGKMVARVHLTDAQTVGNVFVPMHWSERYASSGRVGALVNPVIDPLSKQPESKHTPVRLKVFPAAWYGFLLSRQEWEVKDSDYWVTSKADQCHRYELAGQSLQTDWPVWIRQRSALPDQEATSWLEYQDPALGHYRAAQIVEGRLAWVLFIATNPRLPERNWLVSLFSKPCLTADERKVLLTAKPPIGSEDVGSIVCACFQVGENTLRQTIQGQGLKTVQEVGRCLKAGTNCGSCVPEIKALLA